MKILHFRSSEMFGSPERLIIGQCLNLPQFDFVCASFVNAKQTNRFLEECEKNKIETEGIGDSFPGDIRLSGRIKDMITRKKIDLVVTHDYKSGFYTYLCRKQAQVDQIAYFHGVTAEDLKVRLYNAVDRFVLRRTRRIITVSNETSKLLTRMGIVDDRIRVVPNAVSNDSLQPRPSTVGKRSGPVRIVSAGRFSFEKGFDLLIRAVHELRDYEPKFTLHLYGLGPEEDRLRELVEKLSLEKIVLFCGFSDNLLDIFQNMDFLVMPSRSEGMPVTILEAWSQQLGVVATAVGGVPELITDGSNGLLVPPENSSLLAQKISEALKNVEKMMTFGRKGYALVEDKYTFSSQARRLELIYSSL